MEDMYLIKTGKDSDVEVKMLVGGKYEINLGGNKHVCNNLADAATMVYVLRNDGHKVPSRFLIDFQQTALSELAMEKAPAE
jgi:hypothetical protein